MANGNKLEKEILNLEKTIRKLENLVPKKDSVTSKNLYGKAYRIANDKFLNNLELYRNDKWIRGITSDLVVKGKKQKQRFEPNVGVSLLQIPTGGVGSIQDYRLGLGESLNALLKKREELIKLSTAENITGKTYIPPEVRHLYPAGKASFGGTYVNPHYNVEYENETLLAARDASKKNFYNQYGKSGFFGGSRANKMSGSEKLSIMSKTFSPNDPLYTGSSSQLGHLGIRTKKTNLSEEDKDSAAIQNTASISSGSTFQTSNYDTNQGIPPTWHDRSSGYGPSQADAATKKWLLSIGARERDLKFIDRSSLSRLRISGPTVGGKGHGFIEFGDVGRNRTRLKLYND